MVYTFIDKRDVKGGTNGHGTKGKVCFMFRCSKTREKIVLLSFVFKRSFAVFQMWWETSGKYLIHVCCLIFDLNTFMKLWNIWKCIYFLERKSWLTPNQNLGKLGRVKVNLHGCQCRVVSMWCMHSSSLMRQIWEWCCLRKSI